MQRGPLLQPFRSTKLVLSGPPRAHPSGCVQPFRLRRAQPAPARALARRRASLASSFLTCPAPPKKQTHPLGGFSSRRLLRKSLTPFPGGSPPEGPLPPRRIRLTPFPQSCHGFVLAPSSRQKPRQPRVSANLCCGVFHSRAEPLEKVEPGIPAKIFLGAQLFRSPEKSSLPAAFACLSELP